MNPDYDLNSAYTDRMSARSRNKIWQLYDEYCQVVDHSLLTSVSKIQYKQFASMFVRWIDGEFEPGETLIDG